MTNEEMLNLEMDYLWDSISTLTNRITLLEDMLYNQGIDVPEETLDVVIPIIGS